MNGFRDRPPAMCCGQAFSLEHDPQLTPLANDGAV